MKDQLDQRERQGHLVQMEHKDHQATLVIQDPLGQMEHQGILAPQDQREHKVFKDHLGLVSLVNQDPLGQRAHKVPLAHQDHPALLVGLVMMGPLDLLDHQVHQDKMEVLVQLGRMVRTDHLASMEEMGHKDHLDPVARLDQLVQKETQDRLDQGDWMDQQVRELKVIAEILVYWVQQVRWAPVDQLVLLEDQLVSKGFLGSMDRMGNKETLVPPDPPVQLGQLEHQVEQKNSDQLDLLETKVLQVHLDPLVVVSRVQLERGVNQEYQDLEH